MGAVAEGRGRASTVGLEEGVEVTAERARPRVKGNDSHNSNDATSAPCTFLAGLLGGPAASCELVNGTLGPGLG